jgi:hypothetical protein
MRSQGKGGTDLGAVFLAWARCPEERFLALCGMRGTRLGCPPVADGTLDADLLAGNAGSLLSTRDGYAMGEGGVGVGVRAGACRMTCDGMILLSPVLLGLP